MTHSNPYNFLIGMVWGLAILGCVLLGLAKKEDMRARARMINPYISSHNLNFLWVEPVYAADENAMITLSSYGKNLPTPQPTQTPVQETHSTPHSEITRLVKSYFPHDLIPATAIFLAESGLNPHAMGWNCWYYDTKGNRYSKACRPEDRDRAWSVDCGLTQQNFAGKLCPEYSYDLNWNLEAAQSKYRTRGFQPWSAYNNGTYKDHLAEARALYD